MTIIKANFQIYAVDDDSSVLDALRFALEASGWKIQTFNDPQKFLDKFDGTMPGCVILDIRMPGLTGIELQEVLNERCVVTPVIFLTGHGDMNTAIHAFRHGALDFLQKPVDLGELIDAIERARSESSRSYEAWWQSSPQAKYSKLTDRQKQVLQDMANGLESSSIAEHLNISARTLQRHRQNVMRILGLRSIDETKSFLERVRNEDQ